MKGYHWYVIIQSVKFQSLIFLCPSFSGLVFSAPPPPRRWRRQCLGMQCCARRLVTQTKRRVLTRLGSELGGFERRRLIDNELIDARRSRASLNHDYAAAATAAVTDYGPAADRMPGGGEWWILCLSSVRRRMASAFDLTTRSPSPTARSVDLRSRYIMVVSCSKHLSVW